MGVLSVTKLVQHKTSIDDVTFANIHACRLSYWHFNTRYQYTEEVTDVLNYGDGQFELGFCIGSQIWDWSGRLTQHECNSGGRDIAITCILFDGGGNELCKIRCVLKVRGARSVLLEQV